MIRRLAERRLGAAAAGVRRLVDEPLRLVMLLAHLVSLGVVTVIVADQMDQQALRLLTFVVLGSLALLSLGSPSSAGPLVFVVTAGLVYLLLSAFAGALDGLGDGRTEAPPVWQVLVLTTALYLTHAVAAFRGVVPGRTVGDPDVVLRWLRRLAEVLVPGLAIAAAVLLLPRGERGGLLWLVGALALLLVVGLPALVMRPRPWVDEHADEPAGGGTTAVGTDLTG